MFRIPISLWQVSSIFSRRWKVKRAPGLQTLIDKLEPPNRFCFVNLPVPCGRPCERLVQKYGALSAPPRTRNGDFDTADQRSGESAGNSRADRVAHPRRPEIRWIGCFVWPRPERDRARARAVHHHPPLTSAPAANGAAIVRQILNWFFRNRETGAITVAQWPNLVLWIVIVAGILLRIWPSAGKPSVALTVVFKGGLLVWAADEIVRGVNPWRRRLRQNRPRVAARSSRIFGEGSVIVCHKLRPGSIQKTAGGDSRSACRAAAAGNHRRARGEPLPPRTRRQASPKMTRRSEGGIEPRAGWA